MNKTIEITVSPDGQTRVETKGFPSRECRQASEFIEKAMGTTAAEELTQEYYQSEVRRTENQLRT